MSFLDRLLITQQVPHVDLNLINASLRSTTGFEQVTVVNVREEKLGGINKFNAHLFRLYLTYDPPSADAPQTIIAKLPAIDPELHERAVTFQPGVRENWFYRLGASRSPIHVPRCYYNATDQTTNQSVLLLEDLAPFPTGNWLEGATLQQAEVALQALARLHTSWWEDGHSPEIQELTQLISANQTGEQNLVQELYNAAWPKFLAQASFAIPDEIQKFGAAIVGRMAVVDQLLTQTPQTLVHGDFRLDNIHFGSRAGAPVCWIIDWEDVSYGNGMVDVSWFLGGCLPVEINHHELDLLQLYYQTLISEGIRDYSWEQCYHQYRCCMCSAFVQGILSGTLDENAADNDYKLARVIGERFINAAERLHLLELVSSQ